MTTTATFTALDQLARSIQATEEALEAAPAHASILRPRVRTTLAQGTPTRVDVRSGQHRFVIDEPESLGGDNAGANPIEHLLAALGACQVISYQVWAAKLGITVDGIDVVLTGDLDVKGFFGLDPNVRPGFQSIQVEAHISGPESPDRYDELTRLVEAHCPVLDVLNQGTPVTSQVTHAA